MRRAAFWFGAVFLTAVLVWFPRFSFGAVLFPEAAAEEWEEEETLIVSYRGEEGPGMEEEPGIEEELSDSGIWEEGEDLLEEDPFVETESLEEEGTLPQEAWDESDLFTEEEPAAEAALVESAWEEIPVSEVAEDELVGGTLEEELQAPSPLLGEAGSEVIEKVNADGHEIVNGDYILQKEEKDGRFISTTSFSDFDEKHRVLYVNTDMMFKMETEADGKDAFMLALLDYAWLKECFSSEDKQWNTRQYYAVFLGQGEKAFVYSVYLNPEEKSAVTYVDRAGVFAILPYDPADQGSPLASESFQQAVTGVLPAIREKEAKYKPGQETEEDPEEDPGEELGEEVEEILTDEEPGLGVIGYLLFGNKEDSQPTGYLAGKTVHVGPGDDISWGYTEDKNDYFYYYFFNKDLNTFGVKIEKKMENSVCDTENKNHVLEIPEEEIQPWMEKMGVDDEGKLTYFIHLDGEDECTAYALYKQEGGYYTFTTDHTTGTYVFGWCDAEGTERERQIGKFAEDLQNAFHAIPEELEKIAEDHRYMYFYGNSHLADEEECSGDTGAKIWNGDRKVSEMNPTGILYMNLYYNLEENYVHILPVDCEEIPEEGTFKILEIPEKTIHTMMGDLYGDWEKKALFAVYVNEDQSLSAYSLRQGIEDGDYMISTDKGIQEFFLIGIDRQEAGGFLNSEELRETAESVLAEADKRVKYPPSIGNQLREEILTIENIWPYRGGIVFDSRRNWAAGAGYKSIDLSIQRTGQAVIEDRPRVLLLDLGTGDGDGPESGEGGEESEERLAGGSGGEEESFFTLFHRVPGAYGYYSLAVSKRTLEGDLIRVRMRLEQPEFLPELLGRNWEDKNLYAVFLGDAVKTGKMNDLAVFSASWDKERHILSFETDKEGDFLILCGEREELNSGEAARSEWLTRKVKSFLLKNEDVQLF